MSIFQLIKARLVRAVNVVVQGLPVDLLSYTVSRFGSPTLSELIILLGRAITSGFVLTASVQAMEKRMSYSQS